MKHIKSFENFINESYGEGRRDKDLTYTEIGDQKGTVVSLYKESGKWKEGDVIQGKKPYGWGSKNYQGYLNPSEIADWLQSDYRGRWEVT